MDDTDETGGAERAGTRSRIAVAGLIAGGLVAVALAAAWIERAPIVEHFADQTLADRHVPARYRLAAVGPFAQRLTHVVIGDPAAPDLTARSLEIRLGYDLHGPHLVAVRGEGVRLNARVRDGRVSLGVLDRLLPAPSGRQPLALPKIDVTLADTLVALATPAGDIRAAIDGSGTLSNGFHGSLRAEAPRLTAAGCTFARPRADIRVTVSDRRPHLAGPVVLAALDCDGLSVGAGRAGIDLTLAATLDRWRGGARLDGFPGHAGDIRFGALGGDITTAGDMHRVEGETRLKLASLATASGRASGVRADGRYRFAQGRTGLVYAGDLVADHAMLAAGMRRAIAEAGASLGGSPVGPIAAAVSRAASAAVADAHVSATVALTTGGAAGTAARVRRLALTSASGAHVRLAEGGGFGWNVAAHGWRVDGRVEIGGGGLPDVEATLNQPRAGMPVSGVARIAPYAAGGARLSLAPLRFERGRDTRITTVATLDGPVGPGRVRGLSVPIAARASADALVVDPACVPVSFQALNVVGMALAPARLRVCGIGGAPILSVRDGVARGGVSASDLHFSGRAGEAPLDLAATHLRVDPGGFGVDGFAARIGRPEAITHFDFGHIAGGFAGGVAGTFSEGGGKIGNVPLILSDTAGRWTLDGGVLTLRGGLTVTDAQTDAPRFRPMTGRDVVLTLDGGRIRTTGMLAEPTTGARVADVVVNHDLSTGDGNAVLDVPGITFTHTLQPDMLTPLTLGVVANVAGTLSGAGRIVWNDRGVTSIGDFRTGRIDLAAAFGPVTGIAGTIHFSDLLGLVTPPGQTLTIAEINPGVSVTDGIAHYRLLSGQRVQVEDARWPFANGILTLEPTVLAFGEDSVRHMTFRIRGLDAAAFVQQLSVPNLAATGTFDGVLPMLFDQSGGRIAGGHIVARPPGGTIAYVGEISRQKVGTMGKLTFDALKAIRYSSLSIDLDGRLDGEIVSRVKFTGVRQATADSGIVARMIRGLPFRFNIAIRAPFRALLGTARSYSDPSLLLPQVGMAPRVSEAPSVQPPASEPVR